MKVTRKAGKFAVDRFSRDDRFNLIDRSRACIPNRLRMIGSKILLQCIQTGVGDVGQMRGGVAGIHRRQPFPLD